MNKQQRQKMAMELVGGVSRTASVAWNKVPGDYQHYLKQLVKLFGGYQNTKIDLDVSTKHGGVFLLITIKDHPILRMFSCQQTEAMAKAGEFRCRFKIHDPVRDQWREGVDFDAEHRMFVGEQTMNFFSDSLAFYETIKKDIKKIDKVTKLYLSGGVEALLGVQEKKEKKLDRAINKVRKQNELAERRDQALFKKYGLDVPPDNIEIHDIFDYRRWVGELWFRRIVELFESHGGVLQKPATAKYDERIAFAFPNIPRLEVVDVYFGYLWKEWPRRELVFESGIHVPGDGQRHGWGFDPKSQSLESASTVRVKLDLGEAGFRQVVQMADKMFANLAKVSPEPEPAEPGTFTHSDVRSTLKSMKFGPAGKARSVDDEGDGWSVEPQNRQRLDHFSGGGGWDDDGDDEGWDEEGWEEEYAEPVREATLARLESEYGKGYFYVDVGDKGHIDITLTPQGRKKIRQG